MISAESLVTAGRLLIPHEGNQRGSQFAIREGTTGIVERMISADRALVSFEFGERYALLDT